MSTAGSTEQGAGPGPAGRSSRVAPPPRPPAACSHLRAELVHSVVRLVVVAAPAGDALRAVVADPRVACRAGRGREAGRVWVQVATVGGWGHAAAVGAKSSSGWTRVRWEVRGGRGAVRGRHGGLHGQRRQDNNHPRANPGAPPGKGLPRPRRSGSRPLRPVPGSQPLRPRAARACCPARKRDPPHTHVLACALLHSQQVLVVLELEDDLIRDVLACASAAQHA
jgi:hypothetical protein